MHAKHQAKKNDITSSIEVKNLMDQAALHWIGDEKRLLSWGVTLDVMPEIERYTQHRSKKTSGHHVQFSSVDYQGGLTVADPEVFISSYTHGFGRAKAMGCGLMLIRPI
jgi:CRISPR system Cascade subunit CasE